LANDKPKRPRRYVRSRKNKRLILDATTEILIRDGYSKTTVEKIREKTGLGYGTIFSHYKGKDDIFNSIVDNILYDFFKQQKETIEAEYPEILSNHYRELILFLFQLALENRPILKVYYDAIGKSEKISYHWNSIIQSLIDNFATSFKEYQRKGLMRDFEIHKGAQVYFYLVDSCFWEVVNEKEDDIESIAKIIGEIIYQGLYR